MSDLENLKGIKYYEVRWYNGAQRGHIGNSYFATMEEAEEYIAQEKLKNPNYIYRTKEKSIVDLIEDERDEAHDEALFEARTYWSKKYQLDIEHEKKKLKEEMQYILRKWFEIDEEINEDYEDDESIETIYIVMFFNCGKDNVYSIFTKEEDALYCVNTLEAKGIKGWIEAWNFGDKAVIIRD